jgi:hypothetical protein
VGMGAGSVGPMLIQARLAGNGAPSAFPAMQAETLFLASTSQV